jgi:hypothetical protein
MAHQRWTMARIGDDEAGNPCPDARWVLWSNTRVGIGRSQP